MDIPSESGQRVSKTFVSLQILPRSYAGYGPQLISPADSKVSQPVEKTPVERTWHGETLYATTLPLLCREQYKSAKEYVRARGLEFYLARQEEGARFFYVGDETNYTVMQGEPGEKPGPVVEVKEQFLPDGTSMGKGLFAATDLPKGFNFTYTGRLLTKEERHSAEYEEADYILMGKYFHDLSENDRNALGLTADEIGECVDTLYVDGERPPQSLEEQDELIRKNVLEPFCQRNGLKDLLKKYSKNRYVVFSDPDHWPEFAVHLMNSNEGHPPECENVAICDGFCYTALQEIKSGTALLVDYGGSYKLQSRLGFRVKSSVNTPKVDTKHALYKLSRRATRNTPDSSSSAVSTCFVDI